MVERFQILAKAEPEFQEDQSDPQAGRFVFSYTITITNNSAESVQLLSRHWIIDHGDGGTEEVRGLGVVGHQPTLEPGQGIKYSSGCVLRTAVGSMKGTFHMISATGTQLEIPIPEFQLVGPHTLH